jgi:hypothetical protein
MPDSSRLRARTSTSVPCRATFKNYTANKAEVQEMMRDSLEGTRSALSAAASQRVSRVVMTSSVVTLPAVEPGGRATTEEDWREDFALPYTVQRHWRNRRHEAGHRSLQINLVTVLPGAIIGPGFTRGTASTDYIETSCWRTENGRARRQLGIGRHSRRWSTACPGCGKHGDGPIHHMQTTCCPRSWRFTRFMHAIDPAVPASTRKIPAAAMVLGPLFDCSIHKTLGTPVAWGASW